MPISKVMKAFIGEDSPEQTELTEKIYKHAKVKDESMKMLDGFKRKMSAQAS